MWNVDVRSIISPQYVSYMQALIYVNKEHKNITNIKLKTRFTGKKRKRFFSFVAFSPQREDAVAPFSDLPPTRTTDPNARTTPRPCWP